MIPFAILTAALLASPSDAISFFGCLSDQALNEPFPRPENVITSVDHPANSNAGCPIYCAAEAQASELDIRYSFFRPGLNGGPGECYCPNLPVPSHYNVVDGDGSQGDCFPDDFQLMALSETFNFELLGCYDPNPLDDPTNLQLTWGPAECFYICNHLELPYAKVIPQYDGVYGWMCQCAAALVENPTRASCGRHVGVIYTINDIPTAFVRRRKRRALARAQAERLKFSDCPRGLEACTIPGSEGSTYECLDTRSELEACGGCVDGYFDQRVNGTVGTDCTAIHGVALGGASCVHGRCKVTHCRNGFSLQGGRCVRSFSFV